MTMEMLRELFADVVCEQLLESTSVLIALLTPAGLIKDWNQALADVEPEVRRDKLLADFLVESGRRRLAAMMGSLPECGDCLTEILHFVVSSSAIPVSYRCRLTRMMDAKHILFVGEPMPSLGLREAEEYFRLTNELSSTTRSLQKTKFDLEQRSQELATANAQFREEVIVRSQAEQDAHRRSDELETLLAALPDAYVRMDGAGVVREMRSGSGGARRWASALSPGAEVVSALQDESREQLNRALREVTGQQSEVNIELAVPTEDQAASLEFRLRPLGGTEVIAVVRDVTERKRSEALFLSHERLRAVGELASGVAHNFNNLLQIIMGAAQLASMSLDPLDVDDIRANLDQITESTRQGSEIVKRLQSFAGIRMESSDRTGNRVDLSKTVSQAVEMSKIWWKTLPERKGVEIELSIDLTPECMVYAKEQEVFEAVINLVKNAAEALPGGGMIRVSTALEDREAVLRIEDNGVGIAEHHLQRIFEPFFTTKGFQTAGMGLASTYGAISAMGGAISVDSQQGNGSRFEVRLPAFGAHQSEPQQACPLCRESLSILVIDDLPEVMDFIAKGLARHGHKVFPCRSGVESLEVFRSHAIDVVVCDLGMPRMSGEQVSERIQELARDKGVTRPPFILLTGWGEQAATGNKAASTTIDHVLAKPVDTDELLTAIGRLTARRNDHFRDVPEPPVQ